MWILGEYTKFGELKVQFFHQLKKLYVYAITYNSPILKWSELGFSIERHGFGKTVLDFLCSDTFNHL